MNQILFSAVAIIAVLVCLEDTMCALDCSFQDTFPKQMTTYKVNPGDIVIDGRLNERAWQQIPWSEDFVDISTEVVPRHRTRVKIRWDPEWLYVGAELVEPNIWANISYTCHCIDNTTDQVIFHDNDFEIFIDADGTTHNYKEFEINAANQTWILLLNKPYGDGGFENSSRVMGQAGWDMQPPLRCATRVQPPQAFNNPATLGQHWTVEVAMPIRKLVDRTRKEGKKPEHGDMWRINFSRVEWRVKTEGGIYIKDPAFPHEDNWVWSPQGEIQMHLPERWGMLHFSETAPPKQIPHNNFLHQHISYNPSKHLELSIHAEWTVRQVAMAVYYSQHNYARKNRGLYTSNLTALAEHLSWPTRDPMVLQGSCTTVPLIVMGKDGKSFRCFVMSLDGSLEASVSEDRLLTVNHVPFLNLVS